MVTALKDGILTVYHTHADVETSHSLQAVLLCNAVPVDSADMFIHKPQYKVHILWWGSSQSAHSAHSNPMTRARKEALELDSLADSGLQLLQTDWSSSSRLLLINPKLTSYIYAFLHCLLHIPWRLPGWPRMIADALPWVQPLAAQVLVHTVSHRGAANLPAS